MALSGSFNTNSVTWYGDGYTIVTYFTFSWTATQNVSANTSTVTWKLTQKQTPTGSGYTRTIEKKYATIDGSQSLNSTTISGTNGTVVLSGTKTISHNTDGSKTFSVSVGVEVGGGQSSYNCTGSGSFTLDKIARNPNAPTAVSITAGQGNYVGLGETVTIKWSGASGVITGYDIQFSRGNSGWKDYKSVSSTSTSGSTTDSFTSTDINVNGAGCAVQYRVRAKNGSLTSAWKASNTLYISGAMDIKISGAWKTGSTWIKVGGAWKRAKRVWIKVNGTWQQTK